MSKRDAGVEWVHQQMARALEEERDRHELVLKQMETSFKVLQEEMADLEKLVAEMRSQLKAQGGKFDDERKATIARIVEAFVRRIAQRELAKGWTTWWSDYQRNH